MINFITFRAVDVDFFQHHLLIITQINKIGVTILLVEQNAQQALQRSDRAYVLEVGSITKEANGKDLLNDPHVKSAYLGTGAHELD